MPLTPTSYRSMRMSYSLVGEAIVQGRRDKVVVAFGLAVDPEVVRSVIQLPVHLSHATYIQPCINPRIADKGIGVEADLELAVITVLIAVDAQRAAGVVDIEVLRAARHRLGDGGTFRFGLLFRRRGVALELVCVLPDLGLLAAAPVPCACRSRRAPARAPAASPRRPDLHRRPPAE